MLIGSIMITKRLDGCIDDVEESAFGRFCGKIRVVLMMVF